MTPTRIQLSRKKGWRKPDNTIVVSRPSKWGNPFDYRLYGRELAVELYADDAIRLAADIHRELRGKNLACWCPLDQPCHADILLKIANESGVKS